MRPLVLKTFFWVFLITLLAAPACRGEEVQPDKVFYTASEKYSKGDFAAAIADYEKILSSGYESGNIYYNLGNAYFRSGDLGKAILNYERAKRLLPRDMDVNANYRFASSKVNQPAGEKTGFWEWRPLRRYYTNFSVKGLIWISSSLYVFLLAAILLAFYRHEISRKLWITASVLFVCLILNLFVVWHVARNQRTEAIVMVPNADAHYGPSDSATVFFKLYEGTKVNILKEKDGWSRVRRLDGRNGWVHGDTLERI